ncbi:hypothetical protein K402DRAFT_398253 [Aulographum hederae CBS 113979]|uniref:Uncharacterized protein n=1 Tax=Aulographum hederae CBS 113979 TaxID=1176131 RepID=A0A6G1GL78_9PEZI|nr:hypothetical protein K402DRAFT_398253 [Aulographum hederae CBS 113979]
MGGKAFSNGPHPLSTPRLAPPLYLTLRDQYETILRQFFAQVTCPPEAPNKPSYGDIDFLVASPLPTYTPLALSSSLQAKCHLSTGGPTTSFAIPLTDRPNEFLQLDIHLCSPAHLPWELLLAAYGDLWQIIGVLLRPLGLTATDKGLHVRIPEIEPADRKASMLHLTHSKSRALKFLGLDEEKYDAGLGSDEDIFAWCVSGRFFQPAAVVARERDASNVKSNDRQRMRKRAMFAAFMHQWVPAHMELWHDRQEWTREQVLEAAVEEFGVSEPYRARLAAYELKVRDAAFWARVSGVVGLEGDKFNQVVRAVKRWVRFVDRGDGENGVGMEMREMADLDGVGEAPWIARFDGRVSEDAVVEWIGWNWMQLKTREKKRVSDAKDAKQASKKMKLDLT